MDTGGSEAVIAEGGHKRVGGEAGDRRRHERDRAGDLGVIDVKFYAGDILGASGEIVACRSKRWPGTKREM
jgi:hypothetical protein